MTLKPCALIVLLLLVTTVSACQPAAPTPVHPTSTPALIQVVFYYDNSSGGKTSYSYIKCYPNGRATHVTITLDPPNTGTALEVYNNIAKTWLEYPPPSPAYDGTYTLRGSEMSLVLISNTDTQYWSGIFASDGILVTRGDGVHLQYHNLPVP